uniref:Uncharacterized protein n=1 Tax=Solanum lycopersicum TaxID=4081 RepID=A0A3Q7I3Z1_SOLLC
MIYCLKLRILLELKIILRIYFRIYWIYSFLWFRISEVLLFRTKHFRLGFKV